jgi:hypothetical protein
MRNPMKTITLILFAVFVGCATTPAEKPTIKDTQVIQSSFDEVWRAAVSTFAEMALPIQSMDRGNGSITIGVVRFTSGWAAPKEIDQVAQKPSVLLGTWSAGRYTLSVLMRPRGKDSTQVNITTRIEAYEEYMTRDWHTCHSKGVIEKQIFDSIASKVENKKRD